MEKEIKFKPGEQVIVIEDDRNPLSHYLGRIGTVRISGGIPLVYFEGLPTRAFMEYELEAVPEQKPLKMPLKARFIGNDSLGYRHNVNYALLFSVGENGSIRIERFHKNCDIDGLCNYDSFRSFLQDWETSF